MKKFCIYKIESLEYYHYINKKKYNYIIFHYLHCSKLSKKPNKEGVFKINLSDPNLIDEFLQNLEIKWFVRKKTCDRILKKDALLLEEDRKFDCFKVGNYDTIIQELKEFFLLKEIIL